MIDLFIRNRTLQHPVHLSEMCGMKVANIYKQQGTSLTSSKSLTEHPHRVRCMQLFKYAVDLLVVDQYLESANTQSSGVGIGIRKETELSPYL